MSNNTIWRK